MADGVEILLGLVVVLRAVIFLLLMVAEARLQTQRDTVANIELVFYGGLVVFVANTNSGVWLEEFNLTLRLCSHYDCAAMLLPDYSG